MNEMQEKLKQRLAGLQQEYDKGQHMLADLQAQVQELQGQLLRISGAMQVLQELLAQAETADEDAVDASEA